MVQGIDLLGIIPMLGQQGSDTGADAYHRANVCNKRCLSAAFQTAQALVGRFALQDCHIAE